MYFNLNEIDADLLYKPDKESGILFKYQDKFYFFKTNLSIEDRYNELIAEKIANKLGLKCAKYYLGEYCNYKGVVSEMFDVRNYKSMDEFLYSVYGDDCFEKNNLEDIWNALSIKFNQEQTEKIMNDIVNVFLFDILIANNDRHANNLGLIIKDNNVELAPIFDNDNMLREIAMNDGAFFLGIDRNDYYNYVTGESKNDNVFDKFIRISDSEYTERLKRMLPLISDESINNIFKELEEDGVIVPKEKREDIIKRFRKNYNIIENKIYKNKTR